MNLRTHKRRACAGMASRQSAHRARHPGRAWYWYPRLQWIIALRFMGDRGFRWVCADGATMRKL